MERSPHVRLSRKGAVENVNRTRHLLFDQQSAEFWRTYQPARFSQLGGCLIVEDEEEELVGIGCACRAANIRAVLSPSAQRKPTLNLQEDGITVKATSGNKVNSLVINKWHADS